MAARQGFVISRREQAQSPAAPNAVLPVITVELRVHWPARMGHEPEVLRQIEAALVEARAALRTHTDPPTELARAQEQQRLDAATIERLRERRSQDPAFQPHPCPEWTGINRG